MRHCAIPGEGCAGPLKRPPVQTRQSQAGSLPPYGRLPARAGVSAGGQRSERSLSIDNIARIARGLKVKPSATRCATRSAGALSEIRNERWTIDIRRRKQSDLVLNYIPIGRNRPPVKFVQADATNVFRRETQTRDKAARRRFPAGILSPLPSGVLDAVSAT